jgi:methylmalonyl-CoA mutase C-terminal domain/subunit
MTDEVKNMTLNRKIRAVVAKPGLDGHDRGAKVIARGLRDAGIEVIYTGLHQTPQDIVNTIVQEDPDVVLLSILSGAHNTLLPEISRLLKKNGVNDVLILGGGIIPEDDHSFLQENGIEGLFGPGATIQEIVEFIMSHLKR